MPLPFTTFKLSIRNNSRGKNAIPILIVLVEFRSTFLCLFRNVENYVGYNIIGSSYVLTKIRKDNNDFTILFGLECEKDKNL